MNPEQKRVILQEIRHWRDSKLLPAEYCDFLMNLYAEGESFSAEQSYPERGSGNRIKGSVNRILPGLGVLLVCLVVVFNFTWFPMPMQIAILTIASIVPYFLAKRQGRTQPFARVGWLAVGALLLVGDGYYSLWVNGVAEDTQALLGVMTVVFFLWVLIGGIGRSRLIGSGGLAGLLLIYAKLLELSAMTSTATYNLLHLFWILPAALFVFVSFLLGRNRVYLAPVFLLFGVVAIFGPEVWMLVNSTPMDLFVQGIIFLKLALLISLLIVFRLDLRYWMSQLSA
ncbi:hypothetical protein [Tumebacillus permanentifrigoris]|uniref:Uncharacterized protein n=1 Tax=Tumebacillus permanentifrigoris TaxID=378543 RepID=A0A316D6G6_9BACL|nr:hypothetical protein [Tumebacillus permanentifrigoris]PWK08421.1 hypothetical protein C7459_11573 [Tumebacillus permanentifrigoris]